MEQLLSRAVTVTDRSMVCGETAGVLHALTQTSRHIEACVRFFLSTLKICRTGSRLGTSPVRSATAARSNRPSPRLLRPSALLAAQEACGGQAALPFCETGGMGDGSESATNAAMVRARHMTPSTSSLAPGRVERRQ